MQSTNSSSDALPIPVATIVYEKQTENDITSAYMGKSETTPCNLLSVAISQ